MPRFKTSDVVDAETQRGLQDMTRPFTSSLESDGLSAIKGARGEVGCGAGQLNNSGGFARRMEVV